MAASRPGLATVRRREHWRRAREEYARALTTWLEIGKSKPLPGQDAENPKRLREAIAKCDASLARLDGSGR